MVKSPMIVPLGVLDKDEPTNRGEIKGGSIASSGPVKGVCSIKSCSRERENS